MPALVLALNPSIDAEWRVGDVLWEEKNNVQSERRWAGGKGINVARWLKHLDGQPQLVLPLGGKTGDELAGYLRAEKIPTQIIRLREPTRVNVIVTTETGRQMRFNPLGPELSRAEWGAVLRSVEGNLSRMRPASLFILSGSLPRGVPVVAYARLIRLAHRFGVRTLLDCDGPAFAAAITARPFFVKPNEHELAQWWRQPLRSETAIVRAARALSEQTRGWVLVSRGAKRSLLVNRAEGVQFSAAPSRVKPRNTVGAGDASLAAVAGQIELAAPPHAWLRSGLAVGTLATQSEPGGLPSLTALRSGAASRGGRDPVRV
jgi:1-phosphofructokinase family hexose kinase